MTEHIALHGARVTLAVTGGIAAYKACEVVRLFKKAGADVKVLMTKAAAAFVTPMTFEALTGRPVGVDVMAAPLSHIKASQDCDLFLVAPATANSLAKFASGIADDLVSSAALAHTAPMAVCPAMNTAMWENPATQRNVRQLAADGVAVWGPAAGSLACGVTGAGRLIEPAEIVDRAAALLTPKTLAGCRAVVTAGPTVEAIDPVRCLTNHSSGRQGYAVARALKAAGADVTLVAGPTALSAPAGVACVPVKSACEMLEAALKASVGADLFVGAAAVADWRAETPAAQKMKKRPGEDRQTIAFVKNPDVITSVKAAHPEIIALGFAAETEAIEENARRKLAAKHLDFVVGNDGPAAFGADTNAVVIVSRTGVRRVAAASKDRIAAELVADLARAVKEKHHAGPENA